MKKLILLSLVLFFGELLAAQEDGAKKSVWHTEAGIGVQVPFKQLYINGNNFPGFSVQLEALYRGRMENGFSLYAGAAAGPYFNKDFKINDSKGLCINFNFWGGAGYDLLNENKKQNLILSGLLGFDTFTVTDYEYTGAERLTKDHTAFCFEIGADLLYSNQISSHLCFYAGCSLFAGLGWTNTSITKEETFFEKSKTKNTEYDSCYLFSAQPKLGLIYMID